VNFMFCLRNNLFDLFSIFLGVVFEGRADGAGDHAFEFLFLLNFIAIISN